MKKNTTIKENRDFRRVYSKGQSISSSSLVTYSIKNRFKKNRIGITTSKKIGNAVKRNRARRIIRAAFQCLECRLKQGFDIVFVARVKTTSVKMQVVLRDMEYQFRKTGVLN